MVPTVDQRAGFGPGRRVVTVDPTKSPAWDSLITGGSSRLFHSPPWLRAVSETYGFGPQAAVVLDGETPVAGLPYAVVDGARGRRAVAFPFSDYCDPIAGTVEEWRLLAGGIETRPVSLRSLDNDIPLSDPECRAIGRARWHGVAVGRDIDGAWGDLQAPARQAVRRSTRLGVVVDEAETRADLRAFYELHLRLRKQKLRMLAQPYRFFENIWDQFVDRDAGALLLARVDGDIVAGVLFLEWRDTLYYKFNASAPEALSRRTNDAIMWAGIERAIKRGLRAIDLGLSDWDQDGLIQYKRKYATAEKTITLLQLGSESPTPGSVVASRLTDLTRLLTDPEVPDSVTEQAGSLLYELFA